MHRTDLLGRLMSIYSELSPDEQARIRQAASVLRDLSDLVLDRGRAGARAAEPPPAPTAGARQTPVRPDIGLDVGQISAREPSLVPKDLLHGADGWLVGNASAWTGTSPPTLRPDGWPASLAQGQVARAVLAWGRDGDVRPYGTYRVTWAGEGDFSFESRHCSHAVFKRTGPHAGELTWLQRESGPGGLVLAVRTTNPEQPLHGMQVLPASTYAPDWATNRGDYADIPWAAFNPDLSGVSMLKFDLRAPTHPGGLFWADKHSPPPEVVLDFAMRHLAVPWLVVPLRSDYTPLVEAVERHCRTNGAPRKLIFQLDPDDHVPSLDEPARAIVSLLGKHPPSALDFTVVLPASSVGARAIAAGRDLYAPAAGPRGAARFAMSVELDYRFYSREPVGDERALATDTLAQIDGMRTLISGPCAWANTEDVPLYCHGVRLPSFQSDDLYHSVTRHVYERWTAARWTAAGGRRIVLGRLFGDDGLMGSPLVDRGRRLEAFRALTHNLRVDGLNAEAR